MEVSFTWQEAQREYWDAGLSKFERSEAFPPPRAAASPKDVGGRPESLTPGEVAEMQGLLDNGIRVSEIARQFATYPELIRAYIYRGVLIRRETADMDQRRQQRYREIIDLWNQGYSKDMILNKNYTNHEIQQSLYKYYKDERISAKEHDIKKRELRKELIRMGAEDELSLRSQKTKSALARGTRKAVKQGQD
jgi:hypothetical protein